MNSIIIVSPHPDDLEIGMGGTVAKLVSGGNNIISLVVTDGRRSTNVNSLGMDELAELRNREVRNSSELLGIKELLTLGLPDVESRGNKDVLKEKFRELINTFRPGEIFIPHPEIDKHRTHRLVSEQVLGVMSEVFKTNADRPECWCYEVWTSFQDYDRLEDISDFVDIKTKAIEMHSSQTAYKNYVDGIIGLNRYRAVFHESSGVSDMGYAEVFKKII